MNEKEREKDRVESIATMLLAALYSKYGHSKENQKYSAEMALKHRVKGAIQGAKELIRQLDEEYK